MNSVLHLRDVQFLRLSLLRLIVHGHLSSLEWVEYPGKKASIALAQPSLAVQLVWRNVHHGVPGFPILDVVLHQAADDTSADLPHLVVVIVEKEATLDGFEGSPWVLRDELNLADDQIRHDCYSQSLSTE
jgi:hypothetical protein